MSSIPIDDSIIESVVEATGIRNPGKASIREIVSLVNRIEQKTGISFVRMEMGVPGLPAPELGIEAEIKALRSGVASLYPDIAGLKSLKTEASRFIKLFMNADVNPAGCVPTVGSMMGSLICFLVANRNDRTKEGSLFIDPGFPVQKQQVKMLGHDYFSFDIYNHRGRKLRAKLESYLETGKVSSLIYSNPNNPTWICLNDEELSIIGDLCRKYDVIVIEDLAYFGMDFRKDYGIPGHPPYQPTIANYTDDYILLISSSKIFSYAGQRIAIMAISDHLFNRSYPDLLRYYSSDKFGHSAIFGALYGISAGVSHSVQYGLAALLKAVNDGEYRYRDDVLEYGGKASLMKKMFTDNGFIITYPYDLDEPIADGFYFTVSYPGMSASELIGKLLNYGISAITLDTTGSERNDGLRACVSQVPRSLFGDLEYRLKCFNKRYGK
ncbi:MAG: pyridoxal phosphate-dependent aminotransferase [Bacteroidales bacterium]|jgi:aspartate/methionine/tyrosine aminotransferase|nr:pyridoxal phosphate-dependent aminotransferase [Bacteroidales bacterium]